jgi:hypothetical protein
MDFAMTAAMRLAVEGCEATFDPADGGRLSSFRVSDHELLVTRGEDVFHSGSFVIAPWVGRLRGAGLNYGGDLRVGLMDDESMPVRWLPTKEPSITVWAALQLSPI